MNTKLILLIILFILLLGGSIYLVIPNKTTTTTTENSVLIKSSLGEFNSQEPQMTNPLNDVPSLGVIQIKISRQGFQPKEINVKSGEVVSIALTSLDGTHTLRFENKNLEKIKIDVGSGETRGISFIAPKKGEYKFYCDIPGHKDSGEEGIMKVE